MMESHVRERLTQLVHQLAGRRILVVGDLVVDRYVFAEPARLSREAPVVIARYGSEELIPGGAANAARNLRSLRAEVALVGLVGDDGPGRWLLEHFAASGVDVSGLVVDSAVDTVTKTRFLVGEANRSKQQLFRIDREPEQGPSLSLRKGVKAAALQKIPDVDATILSDYGYGLIDGDTVAGVVAAAADRIVTADSRYRIREYRGVTMATPNEPEVEAVFGRRFLQREDLTDAGEDLLSALASKSLLITRGNKGMALFQPGVSRVDIAATGTDEVTDVSGAGDTVIAVATLALASGATAGDAALLANCAAGVVVMKVGAATCSPSELIAAIARHP